MPSSVDPRDAVARLQSARTFQGLPGSIKLPAPRVDGSDIAQDQRIVGVNGLCAPGKLDRGVQMSLSGFRLRQK